MAVLKYLVVVILLVILGLVSGEEADRKGRCHSQRTNYRPRVQFKKPIHHGHKFHFNKQFGVVQKNPVKDPSQSIADAKSSATTTSTNGQLSGPVDPASTNQKWESKPERDIPKNEEPELGGDFAESTGFSPRLSISADGEISFARALNFDKIGWFHDDDYAVIDPDNDRLAEDHDHFHKIRTSRKMNHRNPIAQAAKDKSSTQQLASTLDAMKGEGAQTLNAVSAGNNAGAGDYLTLQATGSNVEAAHSGNSGVTGWGTISTSGYTNVNTASGPGAGWKAP